MSMLITALLAALPQPLPQAGGTETADEKQTDPSPQDLQRAFEELKRQHAEELEDLRFELESLAEQVADAAAPGAAQMQRANIFNPSITVFGNFVGRLDDRAVFLDDDPAEERIDDRFHLREVEVDLRAAIDPWADGVVIAAFESEVPGEFEAGIEEGYFVLKKLPGLDSAPAGLKLKAGRFRTDFGRFNTIHLHDLPQPSYPRALGTFLGAEGMVQDGLGGQLFLPSWSETQTLELSLQAVNGGDVPLGPELEGSDITGVGRLKWFAELGEESTLELGTSGLVADADHRLFGADATYEWKPFAAGEWRSFLVGGELFASDLDDPATDESPLGYYGWAQYQLDKNLYLGLRYDSTESLEDQDQRTETLGAYVTYYTTEFLRLRLGVEHTESDLDFLDGLDTALIELNMVFGSHPVEPYWVNR